MGTFTLAMLVQLLAALIGASPNLIKLVEDMHAKGATNDTELTPEQRTVVSEALKTVAAKAPSSENVVVQAMLRV